MVIFFSFCFKTRRAIVKQPSFDIPDEQNKFECTEEWAKKRASFGRLETISQAPASSYQQAFDTEKLEPRSLLKTKATKKSKSIVVNGIILLSRQQMTSATVESTYAST